MIGIPPPKITWLKDGEVLALNELPHLRVRQEGRKLEILSALVEDTGSYECHAENDAGRDQITYDLRVFGTWMSYPTNTPMSSPALPQALHVEGTHIDSILVPYEHIGPLWVCWLGRRRAPIGFIFPFRGICFQPNDNGHVGWVHVVCCLIVLVCLFIKLVVYFLFVYVLILFA